MGLAIFSTEERGVVFGEDLDSTFLSLSSSDWLCRLRVPARRGDGGCLALESTSTDLGLYLGSAEDARELLERSG
jgi:hypothetical protein